MKLEILWDLLTGKLMPMRELEVPRRWNPDTWKVTGEILISEKHLIR
jgi:hypothetical protein